VSIVRKNHGTGHSYYIDGKKVDGVTTLLSEGTPSGGLVPWAAACVAERVADMAIEELDQLYDLGRDAMIADLKRTYITKRQKLAVRGTKVHALAEKLIRGEPVAVEDEDEVLYGHALSAVKFMDDWRVTPLLSEQPIGSRAWAYGGTFDLIGDISGLVGAPRRALIDYKTGLRKPHWRTALQLAAYRWADCYVAGDGTEIPMSEVGIEDTYVVQLRDDGYDCYPVDTGPNVYAAFLHVAYVARETRTADAWIGEPTVIEKAAAA